jgi:hypothetical protein
MDVNTDSHNELSYKFIVNFLLYMYNEKNIEHLKTFVTKIHHFDLSAILNF